MIDFKALGLSPDLLKALEKMNFQNPTAIQEATIPLLLSQRSDLLALAQTGTGKTAAFGLPLIELLGESRGHIRALILSPTRELAQQIQVQLQGFSSFLSLKVSAVYGGAGIQGQISELRRGVDILVATPGRLIDLTKRKAIKLDQIEYLILDEADEMLNMGFKEDLDWILAQTPKEKSTWLFSATMPQEIRKIAEVYMKDAQEVRTNTGGQVNANISHQYAVLRASDKVEALRRIMDFEPDMYALVFCRTKRDTQEVADALVDSGYGAEALHGDMSQMQRDGAMKRFRAKQTQTLIATDVAARGIDVNNLTHVIHFALPDDPEYYTHRSGRTARAGRKGTSLALITRSEMRRVKYLEQKLKINFEKAQIPAGSQIIENRIEHWASRLLREEEAQPMEESWMYKAWYMLESLSKEELIKRLLQRELDRWQHANSLPDLNDNSNRREERSEKSDRRAFRDEDGNEPGMQRIFINLGRMDRFNKGQLLRFICDHTGLKGKEIGRIAVDSKHTYFDVAQDRAKLALQLDGFDLDGRALRVNFESGSSPKGGGKGPKKFKPKNKGNKNKGKPKPKNKKF